MQSSTTTMTTLQVAKSGIKCAARQPRSSSSSFKLRRKQTAAGLAGDPSPPQSPSPPASPEKKKLKPPAASKEQTKQAANFKLHTEQRAARRAGFNDLVSSKTSTKAILRRFEEKIQKVLEEEEIRVMRKEMVPKAQLMPFFDRPFFPQRSTRPLTVPKEPSFLRLINKKCSSGSKVMDREVAVKMIAA